MTPKENPVDLLAIFAHPDDAELLCGGTLARASDQGHRVGILDLTGGESGSQGSASLRAQEAAVAARILGVTTRASVGLPDAALVNTPDARLAIARHLRALRPRTVIVHWPSARHPDHRVAAELARDACFVSGLSRAPIEGEPHRPTKILHAVAFQEPAVEPRFVVDISEQMERKLEAVAAFRSQFEGKTWAGDIFGGGRPLIEQVRMHAAHYGSLIRRPYGEPFWTRETVLVDDVVGMPVNSL